VFGVQRKANLAENPHWSGTSAASLISYSATPRVSQTDLTGSGTPNMISTFFCKFA